MSWIWKCKFSVLILKKCFILNHYYHCGIFFWCGAKYCAERGNFYNFFLYMWNIGDKSWCHSPREHIASQEFVTSAPWSDCYLQIVVPFLSPMPKVVYLCLSIRINEDIFETSASPENVNLFFPSVAFTWHVVRGVFRFLLPCYSLSKERNPLFGLQTQTLCYHIDEIPVLVPKAYTFLYHRTTEIKFGRYLQGHPVQPLPQHHHNHP